MNTKRVISLLVCTAMLLAMIPLSLTTVGAADIKGDWTTYRFANEYDDPNAEVDPDEEPTIYKPEAGYTYTDEGFTIVPADYKDTTPAMSVVTKEPQPIKDGIYLQFRIDDYSYDGGMNVDQWICLSLTTGEKVAPGSAEFGGGWLTLLRGNGNGAATSLPHLTDPKTEDFAGTFNPMGTPVSIEVPKDEEGREIYTFEVSWNGTEYEIKVNGNVQGGNDQATALLEKINANGEFYVGINIQAAVTNGTAAITILKYGTSEADATTPVGTDSKEPEPNEMEIAPIADPSTVEANKPAILWTPETVNIRGGNNCTFTVLGDNTWRVTASDANVFFNFNPKRSWSFAGEDFPVFGMLVRNIWVDGGTAWYAAGEIAGALIDCTMPFSIYDGDSWEGADDVEYFFVPIDMTDLWEGRINTMRLDLVMSDAENREFDICFAGMFRTVEEGTAYAEEYLKTNNIISDDYTKAPEETKAPDIEAEDTNDGETNPADTNDDTNASTDKPTTDDPAKEGCGSVIGMSAVAVLAAASAFVALKKKD